MGIAAHMNMKSLKRLSDDPLYKNSFFMLINKGLMVTSGLIFWVIAARLYEVNQVGLATALISGSSLIISFSTFGFDISLVRFLKSYDRSKAFYTCLFVTTGASLTLSALYIVFVNYLSPDLAFIRQPLYAVVFILFTMISSIALITSSTFIALRDAKYSFIQNLMLTTRIIAVIPLAFMGALGIIGANFASYIVTYIIVFIFLSKFVPFKPQIDGVFIKKSFKFSFGNYIANILYSASFLVLPLIVLDLQGPAAAGVYYIAYTVGNFLLQVPIALGLSFFVEGVYGESIRKNLMKSGTAMILLLVPGIVIFWIFGANILGCFGGSYVSPDAINLLRLVSLSSIVYAGYSLFQPVLYIRMQLKALILLNLLIMVLLVGLSYAFITWFGIMGVGYALIGTFLIVDAVILFFVVRWGWISFRKDSSPKTVIE